MTKAQITQSCRNYINEQSSDAGALLNDDGNLLDFIHDATEDVILDLVPVMPMQLITNETITLVATQPNYTLTTTDWLQVYKVERYMTGQPPRELDIIDPLELQFYTNIGDSEPNPNACYFKGNTLYFVQTPSEAKEYARVWLVQGEPEEMDEGGPSVIPRIAHRLIVYRAMMDIAPLINANLNYFGVLYNERLEKVKRVWKNRFQQRPKYVNPGYRSRNTMDSRDKAFYDKFDFFD